MHARWALSTIFAVAVMTACGTPDGIAQPPGFPDLGGFTDVTSNYTIPNGRGYPSVMFSTPNGLSCGFATPPNPSADNQSAHCDGFLPGLSGIPPTDERAGDCDLGGAETTPPTIWHHKAACNSHAAGNKILNPGQKVSYGNITCGVVSADVTACLDTSHGEHGFVLDPAGSWSF